MKIFGDPSPAHHSLEQREVREFLDTKFKIKQSFLTGSYARWTKTKPLNVDIFFVLNKDEEKYRSKHPNEVAGLGDREILLRRFDRLDFKMRRGELRVLFRHPKQPLIGC